MRFVLLSHLNERNTFLSFHLVAHILQNSCWLWIKVDVVSCIFVSSTIILLLTLVQISADARMAVKTSKISFSLICFNLLTVWTEGIQTHSSAQSPTPNLCPRFSSTKRQQTPPGLKTIWATMSQLSACVFFVCICNNEAGFMKARISC